MLYVLSYHVYVSAADFSLITGGHPTLRESAEYRERSNHHALHHLDLRKLVIRLGITTGCNFPRELQHADWNYNPVAIGARGIAILTLALQNWCQGYKMDAGIIKWMLGL